MEYGVQLLGGPLKAFAVDRRPGGPRARLVSLSAAVAAGLAILASFASSASAQVTCGWCEYDETHQFCVFDPTHGQLCGEDEGHRFPDGGDECGLGGGGECAACGGSSSCHMSWDTGPCHTDCGVFFAARVQEMEDAVERQDAIGVATLLAASDMTRWSITDAVIVLESACADGPAAIPLGREFNLAIERRLAQSRHHPTSWGQVLQ